MPACISWCVRCRHNIMLPSSVAYQILSRNDLKWLLNYNVYSVKRLQEINIFSHWPCFQETFAGSAVVVGCSSRKVRFCWESRPLQSPSHYFQFGSCSQALFLLSLKRCTANHMTNSQCCHWSIAVLAVPWQLRWREEFKTDGLMDWWWLDV